MSKHRRTELPKIAQVWIWREKGKKAELLTVKTVRDFKKNPTVIVQSDRAPNIDIWMTVRTVRKYATAK